MRRTLIDYSLVTSSLSDNAFRVYTYLLVHANKDGECWPSLATVATETGRSRRSLDFAIAELKSKNFIQSYRDGNQGKGQIRYVITELPSATYCAKSGSDQAQYVALDNDGPSAKNDRPSAKSESTKRKKRQDLAQKTTIPPAPPYIGELLDRTIDRTIDDAKSISSSIEDFPPTDDQNIEPFESGAGPENRSLRIVPRIESQPIEFIPVDLGELKSNFIAVFGPYAEPLTRRIDQAMVDSGFVAWAMEECKGKPTPWKLFQHKVKTDWADGAWVSPKQARQEAKRLAEERNKAFLESLS